MHSVRAAAVCTNRNTAPVWFEDQAEMSDSCILHSRTEHLKHIVKIKTASQRTVSVATAG